MTTIQLVRSGLARHRCRARLFSSKTIFGAEDEESVRESQRQQPIDDKPWDGEESVKDSVLRMIMDKYRAPLRVPGAARRQLPQPELYPHPVEGRFSAAATETSSGQKAVIKDKWSRSQKQKRLAGARDAALDYSLTQKYPPSEQELINKENARRPKSINEMMSLAEERIREARERGEFDNLPGRGKPLPRDEFEQSPYLDRTEYFLNRIIQRQGAAPPWVMMQQQVDTEINRFRADLARSLRSSVRKQDALELQTWRQQHGRYFETLLQNVNSRLRSYNVMCPASVRKNLLSLDNEMQVILKSTQE